MEEFMSEVRGKTKKLLIYDDAAYFVPDQAGSILNEQWFVSEGVRREWQECPEEDCHFLICLSLGSDKCFHHTPGNKYAKSSKISFRNFKHRYKKLFSRLWWFNN